MVIIMNIKTLSKADDKCLQKLLSHMDYTNPQLKWSIEHNINFENTSAIDENGNIISCASYKCYELALYGQYVKSAYINTLITSPEARRRGYGSRALMSMMNKARENGTVLCFTVPFNYSFFRRYGFGTAYQFKQYNFSINDLPDFRANGDFSFISLEHAEYETLNMIYEYFMSDKNAYTRRTADDWRIILEDLIVNFGGKAVIMKQNGTAAGYMLYFLHNDKMHIYEYAYINSDAHKSLLGFIKNHAYQISSVSMKAAENDLTHLYFCDCRNAVALCPFAAARILNVPLALGVISRFCASSFTVSVVDNAIPENNGVFHVGSQGVSRTEAAPDFAADIAALSQLFTGFISMNDAARMGLISGSSQAAAQIFHKHTNYVNMLGM